MSGAIDSGHAILAAQALGADLAYIGSAFIATTEANAADAYKAGVVDGAVKNIAYTNLLTGVHGNYVRGSIVAAGLDPDNLPRADSRAMNFSSGGNTEAKAWRDIWGCGQGLAASIECTVRPN